jgi:hypothetical protein
MPDDPRIITIDEASEIARLLAAADTHPVRLTTGKVSYRVTREGRPPQADKRAFNGTIDRLAGSWTAEDADASIEYIYKAREEGSRPATRP